MTMDDVGLQCITFHDVTIDEGFLFFATDTGYARAYLTIHNLWADNHDLIGEDIGEVLERVEAEPEWFGKALISEMQTLAMQHVLRREPLSEEDVDELDELQDALVMIGQLFGMND